MIGVGILSRFVGRIGASLLDRLGILPQRWYLRDALDALKEDDLPRVILSLKKGRGEPSKRWELIRQQAVFRCRVLKEGHVQALHRLEMIQEAKCLSQTPECDIRRTIDLHRSAIRILSGYEANLQELARQELK